MALDYSFDISTSLAPESLMRAFLLSLGKLKDLKNEFEAGTDNFYATVCEVQARSREIRLEQLGFEPAVSFAFRTSADVDIEARKESVRGTLALCRTITGDAALLFNSEYILFIRKAGTIYVNSAYWDGDYSLFPPPYELKAFRVDEPPF